VSGIVNVNESANDATSGARMFLFLCRISEILGLAHDSGCDWNYDIHREFTENMQPTGEYEIRVKIGPSKKAVPAVPVANV